MKHHGYAVGMVAFATLTLGVVVCLWRGVPPEQKAGAIAFGLAIAFWMTESETHVDSTTHTVVRQRLLFGRIPLWRNRRPLSDFKAIEVWRNTVDSECSIDRVTVGLITHKDKYREVSHYTVESGKPCCLAESEAQALSNTTGLPWHNFTPKIRA